MRKITCIHPSRSRPELAYRTSKKWVERAGIEIEYILYTDVDDESLDEYIKIIDYVAILIMANKNKSAIEAINNAVKSATGDILIVVSDDTDCPQNWAVDLLDNLEGKSDFCAKVDDGLQSTLVTMPIMDRIYYERYGYIYHNDYSHMFADQELTAVAIMTGKYIKLPLVFPHLHYTTGSNPFDDINAKNNATWPQGEALFNQRLAFNFGIPDSEIVKPYSEIVWH